MFVLKLFKHCVDRVHAVDLSHIFVFSEHRLGLENELRSEREQRQNLQKALQREQDNSTELHTQLQQLQGLHSVSISQTHTQPVSRYTCSDLNRRIIAMEKNVCALDK